MKLEIKEEIIKLLFLHKIIMTDFDNPVTFKSGIKSPIYCNLKKCIAYPNIMNVILEGLRNYIDELYYEHSVVTVITGVPMGGILFAERLAHEMQLPSSFIRFDVKEKQYGVKQIIEGADVREANVLIIEDVCSTGNSLYEVRQIIKEAGAKKIYCCSIFSYALKNEMNVFMNALIPIINIAFSSLINLNDLFPNFKKTLSSMEYRSLIEWRNSSADWFARRNY